MSLNKVITFFFGIIFVIILYLIIFYALKIMSKDMREGNKNHKEVEEYDDYEDEDYEEDEEDYEIDSNLQTDKRYGIEVLINGNNDELEEESIFVLKDQIKIGRKNDNDIILSEQFVSGHHATIYFKDKEIIIEDLNSTNGVFVNGEKLRGKIIIYPNDKIKIGSAIFKLLREEDF